MNSTHVRRYIGTVFLLAAGYFGAAAVGLTFAIPPGSATAVWPPSGIALATISLLGVRFWPGVWFAATLANLTTGVSAATALALGTGNTLEALVGACYSGD